VYVGGNNGNIKVYTFTGSVFLAGSDIIIPGYSGKSVLDIRYNQNNNFIYTTGDGFVAIIDPPFVCTTNTLVDTLYQFCNHSAAVRIVSPDSLATYSYVWEDTLTNVVVRSTYDVNATSDTLTGMIPGRLTSYRGEKLDMWWSENHSFPWLFLEDTASRNITICSGDTVRVGTHAYTTPGTFTDL
jgi:hypothetical protein